MTLKERLAPLFKRSDVQLVILFGSSVKGGMHRESDLDLAILCDQPFSIVEMTTEIIALSKTSRVDAVDLRRASPLLAMEVVRGGRLLYEREPGRYAEFCSLTHRRDVDTAKLRAAQKAALTQFLQNRGLA